ncbi:MAG: hypothetical protein ABSB59_04675 [Streptosporangiaceae bacterium]|jgi:hypothetical protein
MTEPQTENANPALAEASRELQVAADAAVTALAAALSENGD